MNLKQLRAKLKKKAKGDPKPKKFLSTGSTLFNLAMSNKPFGGWALGCYHSLVGDSSSGKTALSLTCLAEASINPFFDNHDLIIYDVESGAKFNIKKLFGKRLAKRIQFREADSLDDLYYKLDDDFKTGRPFIAIVDSESSLQAEQDEEKFQEKKKAKQKGKATTGSFGMARAKLNSNHLPSVIRNLKKSDSLIIFISQTRDNVGTFSFETKTHSGGRSIKFYAAEQVWSSIKGRIKKSYKGKDRKIGIITKLDIKKNRITGKECSIEIPIYYSFGFDDLGSCINYLVEEKYWTKSGANINAKEFKLNAPFEKIIKHIEDNNQQKKLQKLVGKVWMDIEKACRVERKSRYR